jgi:hypothetical protein
MYSSVYKLRFYYFSDFIVVFISLPSALQFKKIEGLNSTSGTSNEWQLRGRK